MNVEFGKVDQLDTNSTGWFIGFSEWTKVDSMSGSGLRNVPTNSKMSDLCVKWMYHPRGDTRGMDKPISTGRTISMLVSDTGGFRLDFSQSPNFVEAESEIFMLKKHGDFVIWGENLYHQYLVEKDSTILTIRWLQER